jgi:hypothetical protein
VIKGGGAMEEQEKINKTREDIYQYYHQEAYQQIRQLLEGRGIKNFSFARIPVNDDHQYVSRLVLFESDAEKLGLPESRYSDLLPQKVVEWLKKRLSGK